MKKPKAEQCFSTKETFTKQVRHLRPILDCLCQGKEAGIAGGEKARWDKSVFIVQEGYGIMDAFVSTHVF